MHELAITKNLIIQIISECKKNKIRSPKRITLELGGATAYKKDPILFYFDTLKNDFPLIKKSSLVIDEIPGRLSCNDCKKESNIETLLMVFCPLCSSDDVKIIKGNEFKLLDISE